MKDTTKYLRFVVQQRPADRKTDTVKIYSKSGENVLGEIRWYGPWRQYCLYPAMETIWNTGCLADVQDVIHEMMAERAQNMKLTREGSV